MGYVAALLYFVDSYVFERVEYALAIVPASISQWTTGASYAHAGRMTVYGLPGCLGLNQMLGCHLYVLGHQG